VDADRRYSSLAVEIARLPGAAERLIAWHVDDGTGRCRLCSSGAQTGQYLWPCQLRLLAVRAIEIRSAAAASAGPGARTRRG
jgi:hypothetical protein